MVNKYVCIVLKDWLQMYIGFVYNEVQNPSQLRATLKEMNLGADSRL